MRQRLDVTPKAIRRTVMVVSAVLTVALALIAAAHLPFVRNTAFDWARARLVQSVGVRIEADSFSYNLLTTSVMLRNPSLATGDTRPFFQADSVRLELARSVFWGDVRVERLTIERPRVVIVRLRDGTTNLPAGSNEPSPSSASPVHLGLVEARRLTVEIDDQSANRTLGAGPIDLTLDTNSADARGGAFGPGAFSIGLGGANGAAQARSLSGTVAGRLGFDGTRLSVPELNVNAPEGRLALNGWIDLLSDAMNVSAEGQLDLNLAPASRFANLPEAFGGSMRTRFAIGGALSDPTARLTLDGERLAYRSFANVTLSASATYAAGRLTLDSVDLTSPVGAVSMSGELPILSPATSSGPGRLMVRIASLDLDPLLHSSGIDSPVRLGSTASGEVTLSLDNGELFAPDWLRELRAEGVARLTPSGSGASLSGQAHFSLARGSWTLAHTLRSTTGEASLIGQASGRLQAGASDLASSTVGGKSQLRLDDLGAARPLLQQAGVDAPPPFDKRLGGSLDAALELGGSIRSPRVEASLAGRGIQLGDLPAGELDATLDISLQGLRARSLEATLGTSRLVASGSFGWRGQLGAQFVLTSNDVGALARIAGVSDVSMTGSAQLEGSLDGSIQSLRSQSRLRARDLSVEGTPIGPLDATLDLEKSRLSVDASAADLNVLLKGELDTREPFAYRAEATLDRAPIAKLIPATLKSEIPASDGTVTADLHANGPLRRPLESTGEISLQSLDVVVSGIPIRLASPATVSIGPELFGTTPLELQAGKQTRVRLQGALSRDKPSEGLALSMDGTIAELLELGAASLRDWPLSAGASRIKMDIRAGGTIRALEPDGTISVQADALHYADFPSLNAIELSARIDREQISVQSLTAEWQQARLAAEGGVPLRMIVPAQWMESLPSLQRPATLHARLANITPDALAPFVSPSQLRELSGTAAATIAAEAEAFAINEVRASLVLDELSLALAGVPFTQSEPTRVRLSDSTAQIESLRWNAQGNEIAVTGGASLAGPSPTIDLAVVGNLDLRVVGAFADGIAAGGLARANVAVNGSLVDPDIVGSLEIMAGELQLATPPLAAADFDGSIAVAADGKGTISLQGLVNGGSATVAGTLDLMDWSDPRGRVVLTAQNVSLDYPDGFQTESNAGLTLTLAGPGSALTGRIDVLSGIYREPIVLSRGFLTGATGSTAVSTTADATSFLETLRLEVAVASTDAVRIDNNYARLNLAADLRVTGTANRPGAIGRIEAAPDGEIYLLGNTYRVQTLVVDLDNPVTIAPNLTFLAETRVNNVSIEVGLQCAAAGPCEREVHSQVAGVTDEDAEAMLFGISTDPAEAGAQLARLLSGEVLGVVGRTVGLDTLRLEMGGANRSALFDDPVLLAGDVNPASRLTFGKRLGDRVELAYSQDLADNGFSTSTSFFAPAGISLRALLLDDQSRSYEFHHQPRFGGPRRERPRVPPRPSISAVRIVGTPGLSERELRGQLRLTEGDRYDFETWQDDRERLQALYQSRGYFEATVRARRLASSAPESTVLEYTVNRGRQTRLVTSGIGLSNTLRDRIVERWTGAIFDGFLERDVTLILREHLYREGRLLAHVSVMMQVDESEDVKTLRVNVDPGPVLIPQLEFEGNALVATSRLVEVAKGAAILPWLDPAFFTLVIERLYEDEGLLSSEVAVLKPETRGAASIVRVAIREGEPWHIRRVTLGGPETLEEEGVLASFQVPPGARYDPRLIAAQVAALEQRARAAGFLEARAVAETVLDEEEHVADVHVLVAAGPRSVLSSIVVEGADSDDNAIASNVKLTVGEPVGATSINDTRRRLYDTGLYRRVDVALEPAGDTATTSSVSAEGDRAVLARVHVEERQRYTFRYGLQLNDELSGPDERAQRLGFSADLESQNLFGVGATAGLSARLRRDQQIGRVFVGASRFFGLPLRSNLFLSRSREEIGSDANLQTVSEVTEVSAEQTYRLRRTIDLRYGYGFGRNRTTIGGEGADFDVSVKVARFTTSGLVDRRSDPFDPARGWFAAATLETSRPGLGSDISFLKGFLQYFQFVPIKDRALFASAVRVGLARTFRGEVLIPSERFFAGGATSVRGYRQDDLGPRSIFDDASGGRALFIASNELRFPVYRWVRGVGFLDVGNVYDAIGDLSLSDLQVGTGAGIRLTTPIGLLRLDVAAPANPRPFDPKWTAYVGLGHAF